MLAVDVPAATRPCTGRRMRGANDRSHSSNERPQDGTSRRKLWRPVLRVVLKTRIHTGPFLCHLSLFRGGGFGETEGLRRGSDPLATRLEPGIFKVSAEVGLDVVLVVRLVEVREVDEAFVERWTVTTLIGSSFIC